MGRRTDRLVRLTAEWIDKIQPGKTRLDWHDDLCPGLVLRVSPTGSKVFYWVGRIANRQTRVKLGVYPAVSVAAARIEAKQSAVDAATGKQPQTKAGRAKKEMTLGQLHEWYMANYSKPHKKTWKIDERRFEMRLQHWASRKLSKISTDDVIALHIEIKDKAGPYAANKMLELLGHEFRYGKTILKFDAVDPTVGVIRFKQEERERFLDAEELPRFLNAIEGIKREASRDFIKLCLFTGARRSNIQSMRWDEINLRSKKWVIPAAKAKSGKAIVIALSPPALDILTRRSKHKGLGWVFPGPGKTGHMVEPKYAFHAAATAAGLHGIRLHDLRRTLGSWMAASGTSLHIIGKTLGHSSERATRIYARLNLDPVREAVESATSAMTARK